MDFKVAGTREGITALQMDIKIARRHRGDHGPGAGAGARRPAAHPRRDGRGARRRRATSISQYAPRIITHRDPRGQDPRHHRPRRQDDPLDHRARPAARSTIDDDGRVDIASPDERRRAAGRRDHRGAHRRGRDRQDLRRQGARGSRTSARSSRSCRAPTACCTSARWRRTGSARSPTSAARATRSGQGDRHRRPEQGPPVAQGGDHGSARLRPQGLRGDGRAGGRRRRRS